MKRGDFIRELKDAGCVLKRNGSKHDLYSNPTSGKQTTVPRHNELADTLCKTIKKQLGIWRVR